MGSPNNGSFLLSALSSGSGSSSQEAPAAIPDSPSAAISGLGLGSPSLPVRHEFVSIVSPGAKRALGYDLFPGKKLAVRGPRVVRVAELMGGMTDVAFEGKVLARYGIYLNKPEHEKLKKFCPFNAELVDNSGSQTITVTVKDRELADRFAPLFKVGSWLKLTSFSVISKELAYHHGDTLQAIELKEGTVVEPIQDKPGLVILFEPEHATVRTALRELHRQRENHSMHIVGAVWQILMTQPNHFSGSAPGLQRKTLASK